MTDDELNKLIMEKVRQLSEKEQQLVLDYIRFLKQQQEEEKSRPKDDVEENSEIEAEKLKKINSFKLMSSLDHLDTDFTEEDLREARREMWGNFPRDITI